MTGAELVPGQMVAPQITPEDIPALKAAGVVAVICNRPDAEVPPDLSAAALKSACEAAGLSFTDNPLAPGGLTMDAIEAQRVALDAAGGPVLAYCASGTRSAILWAFATAMAGETAIDDILAAMARAGYPMPGLAPQLRSVAPRG